VSAGGCPGVAAQNCGRGKKTPDLPDGPDDSAGTRDFRQVVECVGWNSGFLGIHATVYNLFNLGRHLVSANHYRNLRIGAFDEWSLAVA